MTEKRFAKGELKATDDFVSFVASSDAVDRMGDIVRQEGWILDNYKKNPIVLFAHDHDKPIGKAHNVRVENGTLKADFEFAPEEVDPFAAKIGRMVKAGFLNAVSVGFRALETKPIKSGYEFIKSELLEISVVSVPANQEALAYAKSFSSKDELKRMFSEVDPFPSTEEIIANRDNVIANWNLGPAKASPTLTANPGYWQKMADIWGVTETEARHQVCANCEYYNNTPEMMSMMDSVPLDAFDMDGGGRGFCEKFDFICHSLRACQAWERKDFISPDMAEMNVSSMKTKNGALANSIHDENIKKALLRHRKNKINWF